MSSKNLTISDYKNCPHCGGVGGYYTKQYASGICHDIRDFNGEPQNWHLHDSLKYRNTSNYYWCIDCNKRLCKIK